MRKYLAVAGITFKAQWVYRFDVALSAVGMLSRIAFAVILWGAIYQTRDAVAGLNLQAMLNYYVLMALLKMLDMSNGVISEVSDRVRSGTFSKFMTIPDEPLFHFIAQTLGAAGYYALFMIPAMAFCTVAFQIEFSLNHGLAAIVCGLLMALLGLVFMICYQFLIGIMAFKFGDTGFFRHVQGIVLDFSTGALVPLALLPGTVQRWLSFLPFPHVLYTPAMLLSGRIGIREGWMGLLTLLLWTACMAALAQWAYDRLRVRYDGVGV